MSAPAASARELLRIDPAATAAQIEAATRDIVFAQLRRKGAVVAISGGVDSSVVAALCARALGKERVLGLLLPEADSSPDSLRLARLLADSIGIRTETEEITPILNAAGCYRRRDEAIRSVLPGYGDGFKCKIVLPDASGPAAYPIFSVVVQSPDGAQRKARLTYEAYQGIVAATNFKQRTRKMMEYYYADRLQYAVAGTPNRLEYDQGFFVKNGDGAADLKPIAHLYKCQVYQLAAYLGIPEDIQHRPPTTDTYPLEQSQAEFYFTLSLEAMDLCLFGKNHGIPAAALASELSVEAGQIERVYAMIDSKRKAARYLHAAAILAS
jgi:NAD+ synthase